MIFYFIIFRRVFSPSLPMYNVVILLCSHRGHLRSLSRALSVYLLWLRNISLRLTLLLRFSRSPMFSLLRSGDLSFRHFIGHIFHCDSPSRRPCLPYLFFSIVHWGKSLLNCFSCAVSFLFDGFFKGDLSLKPT
jgi:hypothetical protein